MREKLTGQRSSHHRGGFSAPQRLVQGMWGSQTWARLRDAGWRLLRMRMRGLRLRQLGKLGAKTKDDKSRLDRGRKPTLISNRS